LEEKKIVLTSVADPDPFVHLGSDPAVYFDADMDPIPLLIEVMRIFGRTLAYRPITASF
jgi:hypothetical protein